MDSNNPYSHKVGHLLYRHMIRDIGWITCLRLNVRDLAKTAFWEVWCRRTKKKTQQLPVDRLKYIYIYTQKTHTQRSHNRLRGWGETNRRRPLLKTNNRRKWCWVCFLFFFFVLLLCVENHMLITSRTEPLKTPRHRNAELAIAYTSRTW